VLVLVLSVCVEGNWVKYAGKTFEQYSTASGFHIGVAKKQAAVHLCSTALPHTLGHAAGVQNRAVRFCVPVCSKEGVVLRRQGLSEGVQKDGSVQMGVWRGIEREHAYEEPDAVTIEREHADEEPNAVTNKKASANESRVINTCSI